MVERRDQTRGREKSPRGSAGAPRLRAVAITAGTVLLALIVLPVGPLTGAAYAYGGATHAVGPANTAPGVEDAALARAFQAAVRAHDDAGLIDLLRPDAVIRERSAIVAAGPDRVAEWVRACIMRRFALDPSSLTITATGASWSFSDASDCYERTRPGDLSAGRNLEPAGGVLDITLRAGKVATLTFTYSREWEARRLAAMAAPILAAQAATARTRSSPPIAAPLPPSETPEMPARLPPGPDVQRLGTPSAAPWIGTAFFTAAISLLAAFKRPTPPRR